MPAPKGNKFWEFRTKHGVNVLFADPNLLWEEACAYFDWCVKNPLFESKPMIISMGEGVGSKIVMQKIPKKRVMSLLGLCLYLGVSESYFRTFREHHLKHSAQPLQWVKDMSTVIEQISDTIKNQQFEGATSGFFNANIISRTLGLVDKTDLTSGGKEIKAPPTTVKVQIVNNKEADDDDDD